MQTEFQTSHNPDRHWITMASLACVILFVVLLFLAIVQYRWIAELRQAERRQMELALKSTANRFANDFVSELLRVVTAFQVEYRSPAESLSHQLKDAYEQWQGSAPHPGLIKDLLIVRSDEAELHAYQFDMTSNSIRAAERRDVLDSLKQQLNHGSHLSPSAQRSAGYSNNPIFLEAIPALAVPFVVTDAPVTIASRKASANTRRDVVGWSVAQLDRSLIVNELLPALFASHFAGANPPPYRVAIASAEQPYKIIYQSDVFSEEDLESADLVLDLLAEADGQLRIGGPQTIRIDAPETPQWRLLVRHRMGSLDAAVDDLRRRNLGIGAAILLVLAASATLVVISAGRARTLGRMQVELAAAISHELRTPLAVIRAAAYNLETGVVEDRSQVRHYASVVQDAGRRLSKMVDQILLFAETQSRRPRISIVPVNAKEIIDKTLEGISLIFPNGRSRVENNVPNDLPLISGDALLLSHCVQNLISNALKYGESNPIIISGNVARRAREVQICVTDHGPGINQFDIPHIFKPFYRGKSGELDPTGTGLGLALVQRLMERQHGRVSVQTGPYCGTTFTLHIPMV